MSLSPNEKYPGRVAVDPSYQDGKFKDSSPSTANNGSPLKALDRNEQLALQEAVMDAAGFDYNGTVDTPENSQMFKAYKASLSNGANLLSNHNFIIASPDDSQPAPSATPTSYPPGYEIFSGVFANETTGITNLTYIDGRVSFSGGDFYMAVPNTGALENITELVASVADFDGKPRTRGVSYALVGDEYRVTVGVDALEDESANETLLGSVKFEQGSVATGHEVGSSSEKFSSVEQMKASADISKVAFSDTICETTSYYGGWAAQLVPYGGARYLLTTLQRVRDTLSDPAWEPDGFGDHYLLGGSTYVAKLVVDGFSDVDKYGAKPNDAAFDSGPSFLAASIAARALAGGVNLGNNNINPRPYVKFTAGVVYYQYSTVALDLEAVRIDFRCEGVAVISGANPSTPLSRNALGWSFNQIYRTTFAGLSFAGFDKIHEWDTNNTDNATVVYSDCDFLDSGDPGVPVIDTRSFAESRSTDLVFSNCRCQFVPMLLDSYCDTLRFEGGRYKNYDANGCLIKADSLVTTEGGMFVPEALGDDARFFDLYDNGTTGTRGFNSNGTRYSPEGGGISVIYNYMNGQDSATNHLTNFIMFYGGANSASSGTLDGSLVVLQDDGVNSIAPSIIGFYGASVRSNSGLVRTKNGLAVGKAKGRFAIEASEACQSHLTDIGTPISFPIVESVLRPYLVGSELYNEPTLIADTGTYSIDLVAINSGPQPIIQFQNSGVTVDAISNAFDGQIVTIEFVGNSNTVVDFSNGSRLFLSGGSNFTGNSFSAITLRWHRAGDKWYEIGRSSR